MINKAILYIVAYIFVHLYENFHVKKKFLQLLKEFVHFLVYF